MRSDLYVSLRRSGIDPNALKELHRIILTTDGTVTDILEAYFREQIVVVALSQNIVGTDTLASAQRTVFGFAAKPGEALQREIILRGEISESCHLYATSVIALDRLPPPLRAGLLEKHKPIGHLLLEHRIATFKEILEVRRETAGPLAKLFAIGESAPILSRTYLLSVDGQALMLITEKVPEFGR